METNALYAETRTRITEVLAPLSEGELERRAPATPEWRVRDIAAHLSGNLADILAGNLEGVATDPWTAAQVDARRGKSIAEILDEWRDNAAKVEPMLNDFGPVGMQLVADTVTHEHDICGALNRAGGRDAAAADGTLQWLVDVFNDRLLAGQLPALRIAAGDQEWVIGTGEPAATVTAPDTFELLRALIGRRSVTQVAGWKWEGEAGPYLGVFAPWGLRSTDLVE